MSEKVRELYSAYMDGELNAQEIDEFLDLLRADDQQLSRLDHQSQASDALIRTSIAYHAARNCIKNQANVLPGMEQVSIFTAVSKAIALEPAYHQSTNNSEAVLATQAAYSGVSLGMSGWWERISDFVSPSFVRGFASASVAGLVAVAVLVGAQNIQYVPNNVSPEFLDDGGLVSTNTANKPKDNNAPLSAVVDLPLNPAGNVVFVDSGASSSSQGTQVFLKEQERLRAYMIKHAEYANSQAGGAMVPYLRIIKNMDEPEDQDQYKLSTSNNSQVDK